MRTTKTCGALRAAALALALLFAAAVPCASAAESSETVSYTDTATYFDSYDRKEVISDVVSYQVGGTSITVKHSDVTTEEDGTVCSQLTRDAVFTLSAPVQSAERKYVTWKVSNDGEGVAGAVVFTVPAGTTVKWKMTENGNWSTSVLQPEVYTGDPWNGKEMRDLSTGGRSMDNTLELTIESGKTYLIYDNGGVPSDGYIHFTAE